MPPAQQPPDRFVDQLMVFIAALSALGASTCWAVMAFLAHRPARLFGPFALTRLQLISASVVLVALVTVLGGWQTVAWSYWISFVVASVVGVVLGNMAMFACLRRGGPRRTQLLVSMNGPFAALLGYFFLGEVLSGQNLLGCAVALGGMALAIRYGGNREDRLEDVSGPLWIVVALGLSTALANAISLVFLKPAMVAGTDPLAANALRTGGGAVFILIWSLWRVPQTPYPARPSAGLLLHAVTPGLLGFVFAVSLQLYAVRWMDTGLAVVLSSAAPVIMLPMIWLLTGNRPRLLAWVGALLAVTGIALILL
ncbi:MAG: DMT family transporter [Pseudomonadota bacterium]